jgi:hypothetical protein
MATGTDVTTEIQQLADTLAKASIGSIDHGVNAKSIALSSSLVTDRLVELLSTGYKLKDIVPLTGFGSSPLDFRLRFHFETDNIIDLPTGDFIVSVALTTKSVKRILKPTEPITPSTVAVPFSLAVPSRATEYKTPVVELRSRLNRVQAFLRSHISEDTETRLRREGFNQTLPSIDTNVVTGTETAGTTDDSTNDSLDDTVATSEQPTDRGPRVEGVNQTPLSADTNVGTGTETAGTTDDNTNDILDDTIITSEQPTDWGPRVEGVNLLLRGYGDTQYGTATSSTYGSMVDTNYGTGTPTAGTTDDSGNDTHSDTTLDFMIDISADFRVDTV